MKIMFISTRSRYGLRALLDMSLHFQEKPVLLREIAERENLSARYLENLFIHLKKAGIVSGIKGKGGGFVFSRKLDTITVLDIVNALEKNVTPTECIENPQLCSRVDNCISRSVWYSLYTKIHSHLSAITLEDLIKNM